MPKQAEGSITPSQFEGDVAKREGMGGLAAVDEVTMLICPDLMTFAGTATTSRVRDLQGKMIAHCENMGDRMAILDAPPNMIPQDILDWRMNAAGYDSKFATLYYPWLEVMDPITKRPLLVPPSGPRRRRLGAHRRHARRPQGARPTRSRWASTASASRSRARSRAD